MSLDTILDLARTVDDFAMTKAEIACLEEKADQLKEAIIASGQLEVAGTMHKAVVSAMAGRRTVDWQAVAGIYGPDNATVQAHTKVGAPTTQVRLYGR